MTHPAEILPLQHDENFALRKDSHFWPVNMSALANNLNSGQQAFAFIVHTPASRSAFSEVEPKRGHLCLTS